MIPHRMLADDIFENGLRDRVAACRKRLCANRTSHKSPLGKQVDEVFPKATRAAPEVLDYSPEHPTRRELLVRVDHRCSEFQGWHEEEASEMLVALGSTRLE